MKKLLFVILIFLSFFNCKKKDSCEGITCLNDGICINGQCACPPGYSGDNCSQAVAPVKVVVKNISIQNFAFLDSGGNLWDQTNGADITVKIYKDTTLLWKSEIDYLEALPNTLYSFSSPYGIPLENPKEQYSIRIYDHDDAPDEDDYIVGFNWTPFNGTSFPDEIMLKEYGTPNAIIITVEYQF